MGKPEGVVAFIAGKPLRTNVVLGGKWQTYHKRVAEIREEARIQARRNGPPSEKFRQALYQVVAYETRPPKGGQPPDASSCAPTVKAAVDGIIEGIDNSAGRVDDGPERIMAETYLHPLRGTGMEEGVIVVLLPLPLAPLPTFTIADRRHEWYERIFPRKTAK